MLTRLSWMVFLFSCYLGLWLFGGSAELLWSRMTQSCSSSRCWLLTWSWLECLKFLLCDLSAWEQGSEMEHSKCVKMESTGLFRPSHGSSNIVTSAAFCWLEQVTRENASVIQWLGLHTLTVEGMGSIPALVGELGSCKLRGVVRKRQGSSRERKCTGWKGSREFVAIFSYYRLIEAGPTGWIGFW